MRTAVSSPLAIRLLALTTAIQLAGCSDTPVPAAPPVRPVRSSAVLDAPAGPFPSDQFTVADAAQITGRRVQLPLPDCTLRPTDCEDVEVLNTLDGFNLQPRLSIPFDRPIDPTSATSEAVFLIELGDPVNASAGAGRKIGINQVVWDPATNTLHAESDELLRQHIRYALIATRTLRDADGLPVSQSATFSDFRRTMREDDKHPMLEAVHAARLAGISEENIADASVFTTQSATAVLEKLRDQIKGGAGGNADFALASDGGRTVFDRSDVTGMTWNRQLTSGPVLSPMALNAALLDLVPGVVGRVAFGKYRSPDYLVHPGEFIPPVGTASGAPSAQRLNDVYFNLYLPSGAVPAGGWPVVIIGHGSGQTKEGFALGMAATMAEQGLASIIINAVGHGVGSASTLTVALASGGSVTFSSGGRGIDQNGDGTIGPQEGLDAAAPRSVLRSRDGIRQTVVDLMQLVRVIETGVDVDGDGARELDPSRIYYAGHSLGGMYGAPFFAVEPNIAAAALNVPVGFNVLRGVFSPTFRANRGTWLAQRTPSLINSPGLTAIGGVPVGLPQYNENLPLRNEPPRINGVDGAMGIQAAFENMEWAGMGGDAIAFMPHLRSAPLGGVPARPVLVQIDKGDQNVPNPFSSMMLRASGLADVTTYYRHDLAFAERNAAPKNGHGFMPTSGPLAYRDVALGAQRQIATFFASRGTLIIHPEPARFFEVPIRLPLPEELNYIP